MRTLAELEKRLATLEENRGYFRKAVRFFQRLDWLLPESVRFHVMIRCAEILDEMDDNEASLRREIGECFRVRAMHAN